MTEAGRSLLGAILHHPARGGFDGVKQRLPAMTGASSPGRVASAGSPKLASKLGPHEIVDHHDVVMGKHAQELLEVLVPI